MVCFTRSAIGARVSDGERAQAQEVHLQQAALLGDRAFELGEDVVVAVVVERDEIVQRLVGDDDAGGVAAGVAAEPFEPLADVDDLLDRRVCRCTASARSGTWSIALSSVMPGRCRGSAW